ncbi:serine hydrolase domain-containing protein [Mucilaginibacter terrigena]|nr:serine hydrolase domain-containing protein [Mucilaginibacter terrigena]
MRRNLLALILAIGGLNFAASAQTINSAKLDSFLNVLAANNKTMGSIAIAQNGKIVYQKAVGYADAGKQIAANTKTKYRIGSITKMFTGVIVMQLAEEGKLTVETTLDKFYPQMPNAGKITVAMMLSHRSGLHNFTNDPAYGGYMATPQTHEQLLSRMAAMAPDFEPGEKYAYCNTNFVLLGYIIEKITGKPYAEEIKERIVSKIGLADTYYGGKINVANSEALPYKYNGGWQEGPQTDMSIPAGAGAIESTPADLVKFADALFSGKLISNASLQKMMPVAESYGFAMGKSNLDDKIGYGHTGAIDAYRSILSYFPGDKVAVSYTANGGSISTEKIALDALRIYFNKPYALPVFAKPLALSSVDLDKYLGVYSSPGFPLKITFTKNNTTLMGTATGQAAIAFETTVKDVFTFEPAGIVIEFDTAKNQFTLKQNGNTTVFTKE